MNFNEHKSVSMLLLAESLFQNLNQAFAGIISPNLPDQGNFSARLKFSDDLVINISASTVDSWHVEAFDFHCRTAESRTEENPTAFHIKPLRINTDPGRLQEQIQ